LPGQKSEQDSADLTLAANGSPVRYHWLGQAGPARSIGVAFNGRSAEMTPCQTGLAPAMEAFSFPADRPVILLDNNVYAQYEILARLYDWKAGGQQKFSVLIPQDQVPGTVTVESAGEGRRRADAPPAHGEESRSRSRSLPRRRPPPPGHARAQRRRGSRPGVTPTATPGARTGSSGRRLL